MSEKNAAKIHDCGCRTCKQIIESIQWALDQERKRVDAYQSDRLRLYGACKWALEENLRDDARTGISLALRMKEETDKARGEV